MAEQNKFHKIGEQATESNRQLGLEEFSEFVLLFILDVLKEGDAKKEKPRVPLP